MTMPKKQGPVPKGFRPGAALGPDSSPIARLYADWVEPIPDDCPRLAAFRADLLAHPAVSRCVEAARPYRGFFPPGAPDRD